MTVGSARMLTCASAVAVIAVAGVAPHAVGTSSAYSAGGGQEGATTAPLLAEQAFKNIQALRGISAADFMGTMGIMTAALGFDCSECHIAAGTDKVDWAADTPRKVIARRMVNMVTAINQNNFAGRQLVTCWTCHRGRDRPVVTPNLDLVYGMPTLEPDDLVVASVPGLPKPDAIIDKYLQALGGAERLAGVTSFTATGTSIGFGGFGGGGAVQIYAKAPDQRTTIIEFKNAPGRDASIRSYDGTTGWNKTPLTALGEYQLSGSEDRKSTRLNSSHRCSSYAVFCLKKKKSARSTIIDSVLWGVLAINSCCLLFHLHIHSVAVRARVPRALPKAVERLLCGRWQPACP